MVLRFFPLASTHSASSRFCSTVMKVSTNTAPRSPEISVDDIGDHFISVTPGGKSRGQRSLRFTPLGSSRVFSSSDLSGRGLDISLGVGYRRTECHERPALSGGGSVCRSGPSLCDNHRVPAFRGGAASEA